MFKFAILFVIVVVGFSLSEAKIFSNCELAQQLLKYGIPNSQVSTWVCIAKHESGLDTSKINHEGGNHGILQMNQRYSCNDKGGPGKACKKICSDFRNDDVADDIDCAKTMYKINQRLSGNGFSGWVAYKTHCRGNNSRYTQACF